jgi:hypothetical protein
VVEDGQPDVGLREQALGEEVRVAVVASNVDRGAPSVIESPRVTTAAVLPAARTSMPSRKNQDVRMVVNAAAPKSLVWSPAAR